MLTVLAVAVFAAVVVGTASAGWAGSVYHPSDCTYNEEADVLFCQVTNLTTSYHWVETRYEPDATCPSGYRLIERKGTYNVLNSNYYDWYHGKLPKAENNFGGNNVPIEEWWTHYHDRDLGCSA